MYPVRSAEIREVGCALPLRPSEKVDEYARNLISLEDSHHPSVARTHASWQLCDVRHRIGIENSKIAYLGPP